LSYQVHHGEKASAAMHWSLFSNRPFSSSLARQRELQDNAEPGIIKQRRKGVGEMRRWESVRRKVEAGTKRSRL
jgi:hypothetical protein